jgi:hypothetical protein
MSACEGEWWAPREEQWATVNDGEVKVTMEELAYGVEVMSLWLIIRAGGR